MSGGRATVARYSGIDIRQTGDITSVAPEGHALTDKFFLECKFHAYLNIPAFFLERAGPLAKFWNQAVSQAEAHQRHPILIAKENRRDTLLLATEPFFVLCNPRPLVQVYDGPIVFFFDEVLQYKFMGTVRAKVERVMPKRVLAVRG